MFEELPRVDLHGSQAQLWFDGLLNSETLLDLLLGLLSQVIEKLAVRVSNTHLLDSLRDAVKHAELMELLVSLAFGGDVGAINAKQHIDFQQQSVGVCVDEVTCHCLVQVEQSQLADTNRCQLPNGGVQLESIVFAGATVFATLAEPTNDLVHQQVRVEVVVEVEDIVCAVDRVELGRVRRVVLGD